MDFAFAAVLSATWWPIFTNNVLELTGNVVDCVVQLAGVAERIDNSLPLWGVFLVHLPPFWFRKSLVVALGPVPEFGGGAQHS